MAKLRPGSARSGNKIRFHYTVKFATGLVVNSTLNGPAIEMTLGQNQAVPGLEKAIRGMLPGESKTVTVKASQAFGLRNPKLMFPIPKSQLGPAEHFLGQAVDFKQQNGEITKGIVRLIDENFVVFDLNHRLAGHDLVYDIQLVQIVS